MKSRKASIQIKKINGYNVMFVPMHNNVIHIEAVVHSGFIHETKQTSGINHLLEHVLVSGWKKCNGSCNTYWDEKGAIINASTDNTVMKYYIKGVSDDIEDMIEYISTIMSASFFDQTMLDNEKQAVTDELTALSGDPTTELNDVFHKHFFKMDGLRYVEDWKQQIKNLKHLTLQDIKHAYKAFNTDNMLFVVYGQYDKARVSKLFAEHLVPVQGDLIKKVDCFSLNHSIVYTPFDMEGTTLLLGFPSNVMYSDYFDCFTLLTHQILFKEMRTKRKLLYDILITCTPTRCGTMVTMEVNIRDQNIKETLHMLLFFIKEFCSTLVEDRLIDSCKKTLIYKYNTDYAMVDYYTKFIHQKRMPLTKLQLIHKVNTFTATHFKKMCAELFSIHHALCVYQGKTKLNMTWD
jgi:predicted Zn-dependent peptidase